MLLGADPDDLDLLAMTHEACAAHLAKLRGRLRAVDRSAWTGSAATRWWGHLDGTVLPVLVSTGGTSAAAARQLRARARRQRLASLPPPGSATLLVDRSGDGRWVGRVGGADAEVVLLLVPGVGSDLGDVGRLRSEAEGVWRFTAARAAAPGAFGERAADAVAVVSWLGYDPPDHVLAGLDRAPAAAAAQPLAAAVQELRDGGAQRVVVVGHSYGAVVAARAAASGMAPDELVLLGAPGLGVAGVEALRLPPGADLWAAAARLDLISALARTGRVHGPDPAPLALALPTSLDGHGDYLEDPVLLDALAGVALEGIGSGGQPVPSTYRLPEGQRWDSASPPATASPRS